MTTTSQSAVTQTPGGSGPHLSTSERVQLWTHFASTGGADKDRMIVISNWLLAFSAAIIGYLATQEVTYRPSYSLSDPSKARILSLLGMLVSAFALYIIRLYRFHAMWNWEKGDEVADAAPALPMLRPERSMRAPVFNIFFGLAGVSLLAHAAVVIWSLR